MNLDKKGKGRETPVDEETDAPDGVDRTPADGISDLEPAPTPEGLVPSPDLPLSAPASRISYDLPNGVGIDDCTIFYLGPESLALNNLLMTHGRCPVRAFVVTEARTRDLRFALLQVWSYDPATREARLESSKTNRMLMRRYAVVEKAKDADVIGILVGTLGVGTIG